MYARICAKVLVNNESKYLFRYHLCSNVYDIDHIYIAIARA